MFNCGNLQIYDEIFADIDTDKSGRVDLEELHRIFKKCDVDIELNELKEYVRLVGFDDSSSLDRQEFRKLLFIFENADPGNVAYILFFVSDTDYSGFIDYDEFKSICGKLFPRIQGQTVRELMRALEDKDKRITYAVFMDFIREVYK